MQLYKKNNNFVDFFYDARECVPVLDEEAQSRLLRPPQPAQNTPLCIKMS